MRLQAAIIRYRMGIGFPVRSSVLKSDRMDNWLLTVRGGLNDRSPYIRIGTCRFLRQAYQR